MKTEGIRTNQTVKQVLCNNGFLFKLCFTASPACIILTTLNAVRNQVSIFFEHTYGIGYILEAAQYHYPFRDVARFILILALCISIGMVFAVIVGDYVEARELPKIRMKVRMALYEKAGKLDLKCYDDPEYYNDLVLAISEADKQIDRCIELLQNTSAGITVLITTGIYFLMKDKISIIFVIFSFVTTFIFNQIYNKLSYKVRVLRNPFERKREYIKRVFYMGDYAKEIRLNPKVASVMFDDFKDCNDEIYEVNKKYAIRKFWVGFMGKFACNDLVSDIIYILYLVFRAVVDQVLSFGSVVILYNSFGRLRESFRVFTDVYPYASETSLYVQKIRNFLEYEPTITSEKKLPVSREAKSLEMSHVGFSYHEDKNTIIRDVSISIHPGEKIALVGYNGAGKTTLIKLIMRLYDPTSGVIRLDNTDIRDYDVEQYRNSIGTVFQDFMIFAGNVTENVIMDCSGEEEQEKVLASLRHSGLSERIKRFKDGLDTALTTEFDKKGVNLSGGESQKLAVARVFYKDTGLIILDEPSSALDPIAEYQLNHSMLEATENRTVIFISHRLSTTRLADRIIMLEHGQIAEQGTHEELLKANGQYARMWRVQAGQYIEV